MEEAARQFARRILLIHLALLAGVIGVVLLASREVYVQTREQATRQAEQRQALLAGQTAKGIESFYRSILNDLDLLRQAPQDEDEPTTNTSTTPPASPASAGGSSLPGFDLKQFFGPLMTADPRSGSGATGRLFAGILWKQLDGRISHLFRVDRDRLRAEPNPPPPLPARGGPPDGPRAFTSIAPPTPRDGPRPATQPARREFRGDRSPPIVSMSPPDPRLHPRDIVIQSADFLRAVDKPQIGPFEQFDLPDGTSLGLNLVAVPTPGSNRLIVAAVPINYAQQKFIEELNKDGDSTNAVLADENGRIMVGTNPHLAGRDVTSLKDPDVSRIAREYTAKPHKGVERIDHPYALGGQQFPPGLVAVEPVSVAGKKWMLMVITPLADVDAVVNRTFGRALFWAVFVVCSMTAILFSTAVQLIRARTRAERFRNDLLTKELTQAREIQLAWLPQQGAAFPSLDIAALNHPANHISGDFYNWFDLPDGKTVVTIGDVTGHGLSAAFLMATTQLLVHTTMLRLHDPGKALAEVNKQLCTQIFNGQFVTLLIVVLDTDNARVDVAAAGHYPPILGHAGRYEQLPVEPQLVLGVEKDTRYVTEHFDLPPGAELVLYTDGVLDARSPDHQRFALAGLLACLESATDRRPAQSLLDCIVHNIHTFRGTQDLPDDLTLVCLQTQPESALRATEAVSV